MYHKLCQPVQAAGSQITQNTLQHDKKMHEVSRSDTIADGRVTNEQHYRLHLSCQ